MSFLEGTDYVSKVLIGVRLLYHDQLAAINIHRNTILPLPKWCQLCIIKLPKILHPNLREIMQIICYQCCWIQMLSAFI